MELLRSIEEIFMMSETLPEYKPTALLFTPFGMKDLT